MQGLNIVGLRVEFGIFGIEDWESNECLGFHCMGTCEKKVQKLSDSNGVKKKREGEREGETERKRKRTGTTNKRRNFGVELCMLSPSRLIQP